MINYILEEICVENSLKNVEQNKFDLASLNYFTKTWISQILRISTIPGLELISAHCTICAIYYNLVCCICCSSKVTTLVFRSCVTNTYEQFIQSLSTLYIWKKKQYTNCFFKIIIKDTVLNTLCVGIYFKLHIYISEKKKLKDYDKCKGKVNCFTSYAN